MLERLGEFQIKKKLGEGGMGAVYLAYQESLEREVALKVLNDRLCRNEKYIARFKREARSAAAIVHPNVIQIYSIGEDNGIHYFAMEYVRGQDLATALAAGRKFSVAEALDIVMQTAEACACAAEAGIIHRDLKPANIMLTERGLVKVTDFGLAKPVQSDLDVTEEGIIVGTANYMSPEQGQGKPLDGRSDIYSLGVVFFELLAHRLPFIADQPAAVLYMHLYETPAPPSRFNPEVPPAVDRMVARMMAKNPDDRPRDAEALLAELRGLRQSLGGSALGWEPLSVRPIGQRQAESSAVLPAVKADGEAALRLLPPGTLKALVVDDMPAVRKLYGTVLTSLGFSVLEAGDGESALALWQKESPALVLLDLNLPRLDGMSVLERRPPSSFAEVIVISGRKDRESVERAAAAGVDNYLGKHVNL
ncbi:MAG: protein kinase, partial [Planctomycetota bacterium]|nr:protein kinase [Planctomycetota bacterium]